MATSKAAVFRFAFVLAKERMTSSCDVRRTIPIIMIMGSGCISLRHKKMPAIHKQIIQWNLRIKATTVGTQPFCPLFRRLKKH